MDKDLLVSIFGVIATLAGIIRYMMHANFKIQMKLTEARGLNLKKIENSVSTHTLGLLRVEGRVEEFEKNAKAWTEQIKEALLKSQTALSDIRVISEKLNNLGKVLERQDLELKNYKSDLMKLGDNLVMIKSRK